MAYIDGWVAAVPETNKAAYLEWAAKIGPLFVKHGAAGVTENWSDDVPEGKLTSFPLAVQRKEGEGIVFSWVKWPSKAVRDAGWKTVMADPLMMNGPDLYDGKRMIFGGFETVLEI